MPGSKSFQRDQAFRDSLQEFNMGLTNNFNAFQTLGNPALQAMIRSGVMQGQSLGQDMQASLGSLGGGSSGAGAITRSLASSFAANNAAQARMQFTTNNLQMAMQGLGMEFGRQANTPMEESMFSPQNVIAGAGLALAPFTGGASAAIGGMFNGGLNKSQTAGQNFLSYGQPQGNIFNQG